MDDRPPATQAGRRERGKLRTLRGLPGSSRQPSRRGPPKSPAEVLVRLAVVQRHTRSLASVFIATSPHPTGLPSVHRWFRPATLLPLPSDPLSPRRPEHQLLNFNDQSSERNFTS